MLNKESIVKLLETNDKAVARALVVLYEHQTASEQATEETRFLNGEGFRPCHARMGTSMATFYLKRGYLTSKQVAYWRQRDKSGNMRIGIYHKQLLQAAAVKAAAKPVVVAVPDVGNMSEELMVLQEQLDTVSGVDALKLMDKIEMLKKEIASAYAAMGN